MTDMDLRGLLNAGPALSQLFWRPYHYLNIVTDNAQWVLDYEASQLCKIARGLEISVSMRPSARFLRNQCVHFTSQFALLQKDIGRVPNRLSVDYFHGMPGSEAVFDELYRAFQKNHERLTRVRVSHSQIEDLLRNSGVAPKKVFRIPISVDDGLFQVATPLRRINARRRLGIPEAAVVVGSFQKDGAGWGEGLEPKLIKGPDQFLKVLEIIKPGIPDLFVLLTGPARGFVKKGLERLGIPYAHHFLSRYEDVVSFYHALDVYLVASREEGGPKAVLESMASGVPLVTTRVGQAMDLVRHGENGWMVEAGDVEGLAHWLLHVLQNRGALERVLNDARKTAEDNSYRAQGPSWREFFEGFIERD